MFVVMIVFVVARMTFETVSFGDWIFEKEIAWWEESKGKIDNNFDYEQDN